MGTGEQHASIHVVITAGGVDDSFTGTVAGHSITGEESPADEPTLKRLCPVHEISPLEGEGSGQAYTGSFDGTHYVFYTCVVLSGHGLSLSPGAFLKIFKSLSAEGFTEILEPTGGLTETLKMTGKVGSTPISGQAVWNTSIETLSLGSMHTTFTGLVGNQRVSGTATLSPSGTNTVITANMTIH